MFIGRGPMVSGLTYKMMWFLLLKLLVALVVFFIMTAICDAIESSIQSMIGAEPDTKIGIGFEGNASDAYKSGKDAFGKSWSTIFGKDGIYRGTASKIVDAFKGSGKGKSGVNAGQVSRGGLDDIGMNGANMDALGQGGASMNDPMGQFNNQQAMGGGSHGMNASGGVKGKLADLGAKALDTVKDLPDQAIKSVDRAFDAVGDYGSFVADNMRRLRQESDKQFADYSLADDKNNKSDGGDNNNGGGSGGQSGDNAQMPAMQKSLGNDKQQNSSDLEKYMQDRKYNKSRDSGRIAKYGGVDQGGGVLSVEKSVEMQPIQQITSAQHNTRDNVETYSTTERSMSKEIVNEVQSGNTKDNITENRVYLPGGKDGKK